MYGKTSGKKHARVQRDNTCTYYFFLTNTPRAILSKIQKRIDQALDITLGKSMAMDGLLGCVLLLSGLSLTLANSDPHSGFPTWLSNNLE